VGEGWFLRERGALGFLEQEGKQREGGVG